MSSTHIPLKVKLQLVAMAAGQCQYRGCRRVLNTEDLTSVQGNFTHFAHIVADSPDGPRGHATRSSQLADKLENLILLCFDHHRLIDVDDVAGHPEDLLLEFKRQHEKRIRHLLSVDVSHRTKLLFLKVPIGMRSVPIDFDLARRTVLPLYPIATPVEIDLTTLSFREDDTTFWTVAEHEIQRQVDERTRRQHGESDWHSLSVFALAPIPLLMQLGKVLGDIRTVFVHPKLRNPDTWQWQEPTPNDATFSLARPPALDPKAMDVALSMSISGVVQPREVDDALGLATIDRWEIRASTPAVDVVRTRPQLEAIATLWRQALHEIRQHYGADVVVHLFPAIPNSVAIECGRRLLPKADPLTIVYDRTTSGFAPRARLSTIPQ